VVLLVVRYYNHLGRFFKKITYVWNPIDSDLIDLEESTTDTVVSLFAWALFCGQ
jgi:hypothetical protein